jgi:TP901 family phage tail tape measure protein
MNNVFSYLFNFSASGDGAVKASIEGIDKSAKRVSGSIGNCFKELLTFREISNSISQLNMGLDQLIAPGVALNSNMKELSAITGVTGKGLKEIENLARSSAKVFGTDAAQNVESYKIILSKLGPDIAKSTQAMKLMGDNVNILSKQMAGDTTASAKVLTTALNQFGVSMDDPIAAGKVMTDMMNVMSAAAQEGSAELPQIQQALEAVGMVAKTTGLSFAQTNAQIQLLDKAGKQGAEGGVALRNVLTTLSEGRFTSKDAAAGLEQAGISTEYLANASIPLTDRLRTLRKVKNDTALMTKIFGKENMAASIAMIDGADAADELTQKVLNTNSATAQADIIMSGFTEKMKRMKVWVDDVKISIFNTFEPALPLIKATMTGFEALGNVAASLNAVSTALGWMKTKTLENTTVTGVSTPVNHWFKRSIDGIRKSFMNAAISAHFFSAAIMNIPVIGWLVAGITLVVIALKYLWDHCRKFREILGGITSVGASVFHNIGVFANRLWQMAIKPIAMFIFNIFKTVFIGIWEIVKWHFNAISTIILFTWTNVIKPIAMFIFNIFKTVFIGIWEAVKWCFSKIKNFATEVWHWIKETFGTFGAWIYDNIVKPIYSAFSGVWEWLSNLFDKLMNKLSGLLTPIKEFWNALFSDKGMESVNIAYDKGAVSSGTKFDQEQAEKKRTQQGEAMASNQQHSIIPGFDVSKGSPVTSPIGGHAAQESKKAKAQKDSNHSEKSGNTVKSLNIHKLVETLVINNHQGSQQSKESMKEMVQEALLTAVSDFSLATG